MAAEHKRKGEEMERRFLEFYEAESDRIFRFSLMKLRDREAALDVAHDTFARMWDYLAKGNEIEHFRAFAYRSARNAIADYVKKARPVYEHDLGAAAETILDAPVDSTIEHDAEISRVMNALTALPEGDQEIMTLRYVEGFPVKDIADLLDLEPNTVTKRIGRATEALRLSLGVVEKNI